MSDMYPEPSSELPGEPERDSAPDPSPEFLPPDIPIPSDSVGAGLALPDAPIPPDSSPAVPAPKTLVFEDLTLAQVLSYLIWRPAQTARLFWQVLTRDLEPDSPASPPGPIQNGEGEGIGPRDQVPSLTLLEREFRGEAGSVQAAPAEIAVPERPAAQPWLSKAEGVILAGVVGLGVAILAALRGGQLVHNAAFDPAKHSAQDLGGAEWWFVLAGIVALGLELWWSRGWWARRLPGLNTWYYRRFRATNMLLLWNAALVSGIVVPVLVVLLAKPGVWVSALYTAVAMVLLIVLLLGNIRPAGWRDEGADEAESVPTSGEDAAGSTLAHADSDANEGAASSAPTDQRELEQPRAGVYVVRSSIRGEPVPSLAAEAAPARGLSAWLVTRRYQWGLIPLAALFSALTYTLNVGRDPGGGINDVVLTTGGSMAWVLSILLWLMILGTDVRRLPGRLRVLALTEPRWGELLRRVRIDWPLVALAGVTVLGAVFRLSDLRASPPEMTSDHIEKLLDAVRVSDGYHPVFFANNGGREAFQMYFVAFIAKTLGVGFNFDALKLATAFEGIITLPALWWMARQVVGTETPEDRRLGSWIGVALAGLVAISSWHVMLSRLGLRIVLTPLTATLVIGFLARAMRYNRMRDYLILGTILGAGTYLYQANRMLPILVAFGFGVAMLAKLRSPRDVLEMLGNGIGFAALIAAPLLMIGYVAQVLEESGSRNPHEWGRQLNLLLPLLAMAWFSLLALIVRARHRDPVLQYGGGLLAVVVMTFVLYIPMYHYSVIYPDEFWNRTRGRLFGEQAFWKTDPVTGQTTTYEPTLKEQFDRAWDKREVFVDNYKKALRMYHWEGDGAWISNAYSYPALDAVSGGLLILGGVWWVIWAFKRRDPVWWLLPSAVIVMLLPSAMTLAYLIENPNFTRGSGTVPPVYMLAALPVGLLLDRLSRLSWRAWRVPVGTAAGVVVLAGMLGHGIGPDWHTIFRTYPLNYVYSWKPYTLIAQPMREFAETEGSLGNAFMVAYPHWLDHRILGANAGDLLWPNGLTSREELIPAIQRNRGTRFQYDPLKPVFVMYHPADMDTEVYLQTLYPGGTLLLYAYRYETQPGIYSEGSFYIYKVLAGDVLR